MLLGCAIFGNPTLPKCWFVIHVRNALLRVGNKNDREDARKLLSELLFLNKLHPVYHGETGIRALKELARSYLTLTRDLTRRTP